MDLSNVGVAGLLLVILVRRKLKEKALPFYAWLRAF